MKAWVKQEGRLQLVDVPSPVPHSDELLVEVRAVSLNRGEIRGVAREADNVIPGWDVAGTVVAAAPDGSGPAKGARVAALLTGGAWAELARVPVAQAAVIPDGIGFDVASTLPIAALTIVRALDIAGSLVGKSMLVTGASGGVGHFAIQLGVLAGAAVTAVSSRESHHGHLRDLGASDVVKTIEDATGPFDLILESVGGSSLSTAIDRVARGGLVVTLGNSSEQETTFNPRTLYAKSGARVYGLIVFDEADSRRVGGRDLERLLHLVETGRLRAPIEVRRDWTELPDVLQQFERRLFTGKAVLTIG